MIRNERAQSVYSYSLFHITLCLANMYVTMQLTQWFQPQEATIISFSKSWSTVILKTVSTWLSVLVYLATLVIPVWRPPVRGSMQAGSGQIPAGKNFITDNSETSLFSLHQLEYSTMFTTGGQLTKGQLTIQKTDHKYN